MKVKVEIVSRHTAVFDAGDIPALLIKEVLTENDGTFSVNWSLFDIRGDDNKTVTETIEVTPL